MKKRLVCIFVLFAILFNADVVVLHAETTENVENVDYLTAEKMMDNDYMTTLIENLLAENSERTSNKIYEFKNVDSLYQTQGGDKIHLSIIYKNIYGYVKTPNGTDVSGSTLCNYTKLYVGMCDASEAQILVNRLNSGESVNISMLMDSRIVEDLRIANSGYFANYDEEYNYLRPATGAYNCHSYAWYSQTETNNIWMHSPVIYFSESDQSYRQLESNESPINGDIIIYKIGSNITHSGIIVGSVEGVNSDGRGNANKYIVISKWGYGGLYRHNGNECPYYDIDNGNFCVVYYRLQSDSNASVTSTSTLVTAVKNILARTDSGITSREECNYTCEFNVAEQTEQTITISANSALTITWLDAWREGYEIKCSSSEIGGVYKYVYTGTFDPGVYYVRVEYTSDSYGGNITIKYPDVHQHEYTYTSNGSSGHLVSCECGHSYTSSHVIKADGSTARYRPCMFCGYLIDTGSAIIPGIKKVNYITAS